jgi:arginine deiminase
MSAPAASPAGPTRALPAPYVGSEVDPLREVIVHRPGPELARLTPRTMRDLLWDDLLWDERAQDEHDAFVSALTENGVCVHHLVDLLAETLTQSFARSHVLHATFTPERFGPSLAPALYEHAQSLPARELADLLIAGLTGRETAESTASRCTWAARRPSCSARCPTTCSPATRPAGSTTASR